MYRVAKGLNDLNEKGKVKSYTANSKGYANIFEIERGCTIWINHRHDDSLTIDLLISKPAENKYPIACKNAKKRFDEFFDNKATRCRWESKPKDRSTHTRHYVDVSKLSDGEILSTAKKLASFF